MYNALLPLSGRLVVILPCVQSSCADSATTIMKVCANGTKPAVDVTVRELYGTRWNFHIYNILISQRDY